MIDPDVDLIQTAKQFQDFETICTTFNIVHSLYLRLESPLTREEQQETYIKMITLSSKEIPSFMKPSQYTPFLSNLEALAQGQELDQEKLLQTQTLLNHYYHHLVRPMTTKLLNQL